MAHIYITFLGAFVVPLINAHTVIRKSDLQISYHGLKKNTCDVEEYRFQAIMNSKLSDCVIECALREHCAVMNYRQDYKLCELHQINVGTSNLTGNCFRVEKEDIHITKSPCNEMPCPNGTACDTKTGTCQVKECLEVPQLNNGRVLGNLRAVGNRIKYECNNGSNLLDGIIEVATCLENGTWSTRGECVTDYIGFAVGHLCNATNCLDPSARCVKKSKGVEYCHCNFGFEFDQVVGKCVEVCSNYSTDASEFVRQNDTAMSGYNLNAGLNVASLQECINYCSTDYPLFLGIETKDSDTTCGCASVTETQHFVAHGNLSSASGWSFFNRPCVISI